MAEFPEFDSKEKSRKLRQLLNCVQTCIIYRAVLASNHENRKIILICNPPHPFKGLGADKKKIKTKPFSLMPRKMDKQIDTHTRSHSKC